VWVLLTVVAMGLLLVLDVVDCCRRRFVWVSLAVAANERQIWGRINKLFTYFGDRKNNI
jgi:hypothetical protein